MTNEASTIEAIPAPRRRRRATSATAETHLTATLPDIDEHRYQVALEVPDVKTGLHDYECAKAKRESVSRKLCGGSAHVTAGDLARWEASLFEAKKVLARLTIRAAIENVNISVQRPLPAPSRPPDRARAWQA